MNSRPLIILFVLAILTVISFSSPTYTGMVVDVRNTEYLLDNLDDVKDHYNSNIGTVPTFFTKLFGNEVIALAISMSDGSERKVHVVTKKGFVKELDEGFKGNATLNVWTDSDTVDEIVTSDDQIRSLARALKEDRITYKAVTFKVKVKTAVAGIGFKIWKLIN